MFLNQIVSMDLLELEESVDLETIFSTKNKISKTNQTFYI